MTILLGADKRRTLIAVIAAIVLLASLASVVLRVVRERAWQAQAQREQIEQAQMYGPDGRDIGRPMKSLDEMYDYAAKRELQENAAGIQRHLSRKDRLEHLDAIFKATTDKITHVTDSHYIKTFDRSAIENEYRHILWMDRVRADGTALAPFLLLVVLSGVVAVGMVRYHSRQKAGT